MASFPFTNHSTTLGASQDWTRLTTTFIATSKEDRVRLHLGFNGSATGTVWFDDVTVEEITDIAELIPLESVRWFGPAFRYTDRGWTFVHIEGKPYERGYQYGYLLAQEIASYIDKLAVRATAENPETGWNSMRTMADALMLRGYKEEYLEEMRGIADGAAKAEAKFMSRPIDFLDIVTMNSAVDLGQLGGALAKTPHALSGKTFRLDEDEAAMQERLHKCSSFLANGPASADGKIVFGQLFMWSGYTGVHWDVICDVVPAQGHRLVYETFPGGIHSGADFYINDAGIMIGETTVMQTPFDVNGTPQSSRIREAAQYASSIDDVVRILTTKNNGLYTNDWLIGDVRANEIAILLLGTKKHKLWRSSSGEFPGDTKGFYWSINNAKDPEVRKEYVPDPTNAPFDVVFTPWNRDLSFLKYYDKTRGSIDAVNATRTLATSPINRPHACDGKVTTSAMASELVFLANFGKVTLREKFPEKGSRLMPDLPNVQPHLSLGYTAFSPKYVTEMLKARKKAEDTAGKRTGAGEAAGGQALGAGVAPSPGKAGGAAGQASAAGLAPGASTSVGAVRDSKSASDFTGMTSLIRFDRQLLWSNTVYPAREADNWFASGSAGYWGILDGMPAKDAEAADYLRDRLAELNCRLLYVTDREGAMAPLEAQRRYDRYRDYQVPRIRGIYALHQLRLALGNDRFSAVMNDVHTKYAGKEMSTKAFMDAASKSAGQDVRPIVMPWLERNDLPDVDVAATSVKRDTGWAVQLKISQHGTAYQFTSSVLVETEGGKFLKPLTVSGADTTVSIPVSRRPLRVVFNAGNDVPVRRDMYYTQANYFDDYDSTLMVYGTAWQDDANFTLAQRYQTTLADAFTEILPEMRKDSEVNQADLASHDLILVGGPADNTLTARVLRDLGVEAGHNTFRWKEKTYASADDGAILVYPNPYNAKRVVYLVVANSALQLYNMTKRHQPVPSWGIFKGAKIVEKGFHGVKRYEIGLE